MAISVVRGSDGVYVGGFSEGFCKPQVHEPAGEPRYQNRINRAERALYRALQLADTNPEAAEKALQVAADLEAEAMAYKGRQRVDVTI